MNAFLESLRTEGAPPWAVAVLVLLCVTLGFVARTIVDRVRVDVARRRARIAVDEFDYVARTNNASRRLLIIHRSSVDDPEFPRERTVFDCELRSLLDEIVGNADPFKCPSEGATLNYEEPLAPGESLRVELTAAHEMGSPLLVTRVIARSRAG